MRQQWHVRERVSSGQAVDLEGRAAVAADFARLQWRRTSIRTALGMGLGMLAVVYGVVVLTSFPGDPLQVLVGFQALLPVTWWTHIQIALRVNAKRAAHCNAALARGQPAPEVIELPPRTRVARAVVAGVASLYGGAMVGPVAAGAFALWLGADLGPGAAVVAWVIASLVVAWPVSRAFDRWPVAGSPPTASWRLVRAA